MTMLLHDESATEVVHFPSLEKLMLGEDGTPVTDLDFLDEVVRSGRALVLAPPGAGKSSLVHRLGAIAGTFEITTNSLPALLAEVAQARDPDGFRLWLLDAAKRPRGRKMIICLDGLDEVSPSKAQQVLDAVEIATRNDPQLGVVVTDRITRRAVQLDRWQLFGVGGGAAPSDWRRLPFFRGDGAAAGSRAEAVRNMIAPQTLNSPQLLQAIGTGALAWLRHADSTALLSREVVELVGQPAFRSLQEAGLVCEVGGVVQFRHLFFHLFLAAHEVAKEPDHWNAATWDALTLGGANFTGLGLLVDQVDQNLVDPLIRSIDGWNYLASVSLLAEDPTGTGRVSGDLASALILLLGLRRFSPSLNTSLLSTDLLRIHARNDLAARALQASSLQELVALAGEVPDHGTWWHTWLEVFSGQDQSNLLRVIEGDDGVLGWTAANVLGGQPPSPEIAAALLSLAFNSRSTDVRWRAVHALGSSSDPEVAASCLAAFRREEEEWVQYGALKVFIQVVARISDTEARRDLCAELAQLSDLIRGNPRWEREIERAVDLRAAPPDWAESFGLVIGELWMSAQTLPEEDRWRAASAMLQIDREDPFGVLLRPMPNLGDT